MVNNFTTFRIHVPVYGYTSDWKVNDVVLDFDAKTMDENRYDHVQVFINPAEYCKVIGSIVHNNRINNVAMFNVVVKIGSVSYNGDASIGRKNTTINIRGCCDHHLITLSCSQTIRMLTDFRLAFESCVDVFANMELK